MRKLEDYRIKDFAFDERRWHIDWVGAVTFAERYRRASQPLIEVQLSSLPESPANLDSIFAKNDAEPRDNRQVRLPVALMPLLRIGDIWEGGRLVESPAYDIADFPDLKIDRTTASIIKAGLNADDEGHYYLPWEHHSFHMRHTQSYCVLINAGGTKVIVPATELIRFYFGTSGDLIARLFDAPFEESKFWNSTELPDNRGNVKIDLASGVSCRSATTVARMAFSTLARHAAEIIGRSCVAATVSGQRAYPKALFPFEGHTDLAASGRWLPFMGVERGLFLVFRLLSCSHPFPFAGLHYTGERKDAPNGKTGFGSASKSGARASPDRFSRQVREPKSVVDEEPDKKKAPREVNLDPLARDPFPDLTNMHIAKVDIDFVPTVVMTVGDSAHLTGVSVGDGGTSRSMQPVDFVAAGPVMDAAEQDGRARKFEPAVAVFLGLLSSLVGQTRFTGLDVVRLDRRQRHDYLCTMPKIVDEDGVIHPWCLSADATGGERNRKISIGRIQEFYATHYVLLPEPRAEVDGSPGELELHMITDRTRSISREKELLAALTIHVVRTDQFDVHTQLGEGVESIKYAIRAPVDAAPANLGPVLAAARGMFMAFVRRGDTPASHSAADYEIA